jgi:hypothetical protein
MQIQHLLLYRLAMSSRPSVIVLIASTSYHLNSYFSLFSTSLNFLLFLYDLSLIYVSYKPLPFSTKLKAFPIIFLAAFLTCFPRTPSGTSAHYFLNIPSLLYIVESWTLQFNIQLLPLSSFRLFILECTNTMAFRKVSTLPKYQFKIKSESYNMAILNSSINDISPVHPSNLQQSYPFSRNKSRRFHK